MSEKWLLLTGKLAEPALHGSLQNLKDINYSVLQIGVSVAALMTSKLIKRRVTNLNGATHLMLPGKSDCDEKELSQHFGIPVIKGPESLREIPKHFNQLNNPVDMSKHSIKIFAEIVEAPNLSSQDIVKRALTYKEQGADVIDLGCLPNQTFEHLPEAINLLKQQGFNVSVDSANEQELLTGAQAGADYLLNLHEDSLWIAEQTYAVPIVVPKEPNDLDSLRRSILKMQALQKPFIIDPLLHPFPHGLSHSLASYYNFRQEFPEVQMLMGVGNITELFDADSSGVNALLISIATELGINQILTTQVSPHTRNTIKEIDTARRLCFRAAHEQSLARDYPIDLLTVRSRTDFPEDLTDVKRLASAVKDPSFRIQVTKEGIHLYNRDGFYTGTDPYEIFKLIPVELTPDHANYLGVQLARAQIAWQLGKPFVQDQFLKWGAANDS